MLKYYNYDIVFQEIPDEVTLAVNISNCPNHCEGCHSPHLQQDIGIDLTAEVIVRLMEQYQSAVTCLCFMGGDQAPAEIEKLASFCRRQFPKIKIGWYSGKSNIPADIDLPLFDFIKTGGYVASLGGLKDPRTNQRLYAISPDARKTDITARIRL